MTTHNGDTTQIPVHNSPTDTFFDELSAFIEVSPLPAESYLDELITSSANSVQSEQITSCFPSSVTHEVHQRQAVLQRPSSLVEARRLELEDNYERKKKRAKINRQDLNTRFLQLMDILHIQEDRKVNRAKVLETAIEHIHKLQNELTATQQLLRDTLATRPVTRPTTSSPIMFPPPNTLLQWPMAMPFMPSSIHFPTPMTPPVHVTASNRTTVAPSRLKRARPTVHERSSFSFLYITHVVPFILELCDVWSLVHLLQTNRELMSVCRRNSLWKALFKQRWGIEPTSIRQSIENNIQSCQILYVQAHQQNRMPYADSFYIKYPHATPMASGQTSRLGLWVFLSQRSNHRTTRTVLTKNGRILVRQVVEVLVVLQNFGSIESVYTTADPIVQVRTVAGSTLFCESASSETGGHLTPTLNRWISSQLDDEGIETENLTELKLLHHDSCVWRVFVECPGQEMEDEFLQSVQSVSIACQLTHKSNMRTIYAEATADNLFATKCV